MENLVWPSESQSIYLLVHTSFPTTSVHSKESWFWFKASNFCYTLETGPSLGLLLDILLALHQMPPAAGQKAGLGDTRIENTDSNPHPLLNKWEWSCALPEPHSRADPVTLGLDHLVRQFCIWVLTKPNICHTVTWSREKCPHSPLSFISCSRCEWRFCLSLTAASGRVDLAPHPDSIVELTLRWGRDEWCLRAWY